MNEESTMLLVFSVIMLLLGAVIGYNTGYFFGVSETMDKIEDKTAATGKVPKMYMPPPPPTKKRKYY